MDARGDIAVNERLETTAPNVWAVGDCAGSQQFTHVAFDDFRIVRDTLNGRVRTTRDRLVPFCMYTDPELARVGLNESEAKSEGIADRMAKIPMAAVLRTRTLSAPRGLMCVLRCAFVTRLFGISRLRRCRRRHDQQRTVGVAQDANGGRAQMQEPAAPAHHDQIRIDIRRVRADHLRDWPGCNTQLRLDVAAGACRHQSLELPMSLAKHVATVLRDHPPCSMAEGSTGLDGVNRMNDRELSGVASGELQRRVNQRRRCR